MHATRLALLCATALLLTGCGELSRSLDVPAHFTSHQVCSGAFVGGVDPDQFYRENVGPGIAPGDGLTTYEVDRRAKAVTAHLSVLASSRAEWRGALGCQVVRAGQQMPPVPALAPPGPDLIGEIAPDHSVEPADPRLKAAIDAAFAETATAPHRHTKTILILHKGRVIAERYAPGYGIGTPQIGWSMTKSVTNALIGILVRQGKLDIYAPAPVPEWADPSDPRHAITPDNLMRMESGLKFGQSLMHPWDSMFDLSVHMEFDTPDMAGMAARAELFHTPGTFWNYTNGNILLLSRILREKAGGIQQTYDFMQRELFDPLGMRHVTLEADGSGTPIGSSHMWASARDWARFGLLYLNDGVVGGQRILPEGWVAYSAKLTPGSEQYGYGAGWWTERGTSGGAALRVAAGIPAGSFMARGSEGQYLIVIPARQLIVLRLGSARTDRDDLAMVAHLVKETVAVVDAPN